MRPRATVFDFRRPGCYNRDTPVPEHSFRRPRAAVAAVLAGAVLTMGCQSGEVGPTLSATVTNVVLQPTVAGLVGGENVCCCHIRGVVTNTSPVTVHAELQFPARGRAGEPLGTGIDLQLDLAPGASRPFLAVGITSACKDVTLSQIVADKQIKLKGLWQPSAS